MLLDLLPRKRAHIGTIDRKRRSGVALRRRLLHQPLLRDADLLLRA